MLDARELGDALRCEVRHAREFVAREGRLLAGALHLDESARAGRDDVGIDIGPAVFLVGQIEDDLTIDDAYRDRRDGISERIAVEMATGSQSRHGEPNQENSNRIVRLS